MSNNVECLDDVLRIEKTPLDQQSFPETSYEIICRAASLYGESSAIEFFLDSQDFRLSFSTSYLELLENVTRCANMFREHGVQRHDVVGFVLPNLPETHSVIWGGEAAGRVFSVNPMLDTEQLATLIRSAKVKWLVCLGPTPGSDIWEKCVDACIDNDYLEGIFSLNLSPYLSGIKQIGLAAASLHGRVLAKRRLNKPVINFHTELRKHTARYLTFEPPSKDDIASYFCTGGTTGLPKIAARTHFSETYNAWSMRKVVEGAFSPGKAVFCGLPLFHVNGQIVTGLTQWLSGGRVVMGTPQGYRGEGVVANFWKIVEHYRLSAFSGVPTLYAALMEQPIGDADISSLEVAICGAAPMSTDLFKRFQHSTGIPILEGYGLTEGTCASSLNPGLSENTIGSIGFRLPYQDMKALITDDDGNYVRDAKVNEVASIAIKGPNVFSGYLEASQNKGIWIYRQEEKWLNTGDLGRQDEQGYFWLTGRKKELIIRGGHNIDPIVIEEALYSHKKVKLAAAIGRPCSYAGEVPVAYVELVEGEEMSEDEFMVFAEKQVKEKAAWPKAVTVVDTMPVTPVGKIFKPELHMREIAHIVHKEAESIGEAIHQVLVKQDPSRGLVAHIDTPGNATMIQHCLQQYSFHIEFV